MNALHARIVARLASGMIAIGSAMSASAHTVPAIWHSRRIELAYSADSTLYRCAELASRVGAILKAVGARPRAHVESHCNDYDRYQVLRFEVEIAVEATEANVVAATTYTAEQRLLAHIQGRSLPSAADLARFPAAWKKVSIMRIRSPRLEAGDCALLQAMRRQVFPLLSIRGPAREVRCNAAVATHIRPSFTVEALVASDSSRPGVGPAT